ncbi:serine hydrolase domain-containing protein [Paenibacillus agilis]|uniref:serine hydrolase domain-containing protein n=1 Tax=Paenibacillus agilis TaxID=3020863 RepID=UPI0021BDE846|nr:serine hydrolase [Paenibacillus agilis]
MQITWNEETKHLSDVLKNEKIHSCLISRDGTLVFQHFKNSKSEKKLHKINSCTKSFTSCLIGIAKDKGLLPELSTPIIELFPELRRSSDSRKQLITIDHLLTMSAGFDWPELSEWDGWPEMIHSPNWVKFVLERPLISNPGESMNYNSGCSQLLTAILHKVTNVRANEFADKHLFSHLQFNNYIWHDDPRGVNIGGFGLHLSVQDMLKFGQLYLNKGRWGKKRLISENWISLTTRPEYLTYKSFGYYGRHWWISETVAGEPFYFAMGMGGNYICIAPMKNIVIAITNDTYGNTLVPLDIIKSVLSLEGC